MSAELQAEVERLRAELEAYRQRELADLKTALATARQDAEHFRREAQRNADIGRQIAAEAEARIATLKAQVEAIQQADAHATRFARPT
jgi:hypothetical protein